MVLYQLALCLVTFGVVGTFLGVGEWAVRKVGIDLTKYF